MADSLTQEQLQLIQEAVIEAIQKQGSEISDQAVTNILNTIPTLITALLTAGGTGVISLALGLSGVVANLLNGLTGTGLVSQLVNVTTEFVPIQPDQTKS